MPEKLPPHDITAEEAVIGSLLIDGTVMYKLVGWLQSTDFYGERNQWLYETCLSLYQRNEAINQITIAQELHRQNRLEDCGGAAYLSHLISISPTPLEIEDHARIVYRLSVSRRLISAAEQISAIGYAAEPDPDTSLSKAEDVLFRVLQGQSQRDFTHISEVLDHYFQDSTTHVTLEESERVPLPHIQSGFFALDDFLNGLQRSDLIVLGGRPSMGKSSLALGIAQYAAVQQKACVALFSLEMAQESIVQRLLSFQSGVKLHRIRFGGNQNQEGGEDERKIMNAAGILSEAPIYINDRPLLSMLDIKSKAIRLHHEHPIDLVIVDYLQLIEPDLRSRSEDRVRDISFITRSLKGLAREMNVPVIAVSQLSRAVESRTSHRPQLYDLRESGSIEQDADVVMFVYREEVYYTSESEWKNATGQVDVKYPPPTEIIIAKHRNGPIGTVKVLFKPELAKFENEPKDAIEERSLL